MGREEQIARIQQIERIQALEAKGSGSDPNQPSVAAIGVTDGPTPAKEKDWIDHAGGIVKRGIEKNPMLNAVSMAHDLVGQTDVGKIAQDVAGRAAGYIGGVTRTLAAKLAGMVKPGDNPVDLIGKDGVNTLLGSAPGLGDYAERLGLPSVSGTIPGTKRTLTSKDVLNALNPLLDPLMYGALKKTGESSYRSGFKKIDERLVEQGKTPLSTKLLENGAPAGSTKQLAPKIAEIGNEAKATRDAAYDTVDSKGVKYNPGLSPTPQAEAVLAEMRDDPNLRAQADTLEEHLNNYKNNGSVPISTLSKWKSNLANSLPRAFYTESNGRARLTDWGAKYKDALSADFRKSVIDAGDFAEPGLGTKIENANDTMASTIEAGKPIRNQIRRANTKDIITVPKAALAVVKPEAAVTALAAELAKSTWARTWAGKAMMAPPTDAVRAALLESNLRNDQQPRPSPWALPEAK